MTGPGHFGNLGTLLFGNRFFVNFECASRSHFRSLSLPFRLNFGVFLVPLAYSWESWILKPLSRETHTSTDLSLDYLIFLVFIAEHSIGMTFHAFFVILLIFLGFI